MIQARHRWVFPDPIRLDPAYRAAAHDLGLGAFAAAVLARRGVADVAGLASFLGPAEAGLHDPHLLPDAGALVGRVVQAMANGERVMVFGDFDADGLTALAQLVLALRRLALDVLPYVPSRLEEGHGLSMASVEAAATQGVALIITVDTGSTSVAEVAAARERGIDVVITDHHHLPDVLPAAVALVNPHRADSDYPDPSLSGSGVAFTVARLLLGELADDPDAALGLADLATIGTVSDVVPLLGENRAIARLGLERIRTAPRPGIAALLARAGVDPATVDLETVGFVLAPRLNAAGRVGEALDAANLLLAGTPEQADALAAALESANSTRRDLMRSAIAQARAGLGLPDPGQAPGQQPLLDAEPVAAEVVVGGGAEAPALVLRGPWSVGIIGLVAGRLADETGKPAVVGTVLGDVVRASCRGDGRANLAHALDACDDLLIRHGGHAAAAGFELPLASWDAFVARFLAIAEASRPEDPRPPLAVDLALPSSYVDYALYRDLARLAPCGPGNAIPLVAVLGLTVARVRAANGGHTQLVLRRERDVLDGIAFGRADLAGSLVEGDRVDVVARLSSRSFGGLETLQLEVRDVAPSGSHPRAAAVLERIAGRTGGQSVVDRVPVPATGGPA
ncbi:MAG: single-stranded-DNA-specific exonuclease RecJ [Candidatus Limnocylindrales bacterium]